MNIYEMLKAGESVESIRAAFGKELAEANERLRKEKETDLLIHNLIPAREDLINSIIKYIEIYLEILYGNPCLFSNKKIKELEQGLINQEKELKIYIKNAPHLTPDETRDEFTKFIKDYIIKDTIKKTEFPF